MTESGIKKHPGLLLLNIVWDDYTPLNQHGGLFLGLLTSGNPPRGLTAQELQAVREEFEALGRRAFKWCRDVATEKNRAPRSAWRTVKRLAKKTEEQFGWKFQDQPRLEGLYGYPDGHNGFTPFNHLVGPYPLAKPNPNGRTPRGKNKNIHPSLKDLERDLNLQRKKAS